jgi:hypothetical protein
MPSNDEKATLKYDNVVVTSRGMAETYGKKIVIFVPAAEIDRVTLKFGRSDHRPIFSMTVGIVFALIGVGGIVEFFLAMGGYRYELGMVALGIIGGSMIFDTLKERYFPEIDKKTGLCRLVFSKSAKRDEVVEFCNKVRTTYNYQINDDVQYRA